MEARPYWSTPISELLQKLESSPQGLSAAVANIRNARKKPEHLQTALVQDVLMFFGQFKSPLQLILIVAVVLSSILGEFSNSFIILGIILLSGTLGFLQERKASRAMQSLRALVRITATVLRDGQTIEVPVTNVVDGDVVHLKAGDIIPADCVLLESRDLHANESTLTGESYPVEKSTALSPSTAALAQRTNCLFQGTSVVSGTASALVVKTGSDTELGQISSSLVRHQPLTAFEDGLRRFGYMVMRATLLLSATILIVNVYFGKPLGDSVLFALALAVGMAPELLPAIVTITLSAGATRMAARKVVVKKLASIQNLGSINILCSDKTGTLTEGLVRVQAIVDGDNNPSPQARTYAYLNATFETGFANPLDEAIRSLPDCDISAYTKVDEIPYDFIRRRLSIAVAHKENHILITKGAPANILDICDSAVIGNRTFAMSEVRNTIMQTHARFCADGLRAIGVCYKDISGDPIISKEDEVHMTFLGFIVLADVLKSDVSEAINQLRSSGVQLKVITGDNILVARHIGSRIGLRPDNIISGAELKHISDEALPVKIRDVEIFAETEPNQKERLVRAFRKAGNVVGYIGDGINDVSALHAADVGISVDTAVDVAKDAADIVLLEKDLNVLHDGILEGRKTFINSLKYIFITTSANFGNMFSMAGTSLFLPFLPLLPNQILLLNLMNDVPAMAIASDKVDPESLAKPRRWDAPLIRKFMIVFGIESSLFDFITFGTLLYLFGHDISLFQTGWFMESILTSLLTLLIMRTHRPLLQSPPGRYLLVAVVSVACIGILIPFLPFSSALGFKLPPALLTVTMIAIVLLYGLIAEFTKQYFFKRINY